MRRPALIALALTASLLALSGGASQATGPTETPAPSSPPSSTPTAPSPLTSPTTTPIGTTPEPSPTPTPAATPAHSGALKPGDWVQVVGEGCLNARSRPGLNPTYPEEDPDDSILNCLPEGFIGRLESSGPDKIQQPVVLDGHTWWYMVAQGWLSEQFLAFHHEGGDFWPPRTDLSGAGLIAYIGLDRNIWLMNADGSNARAITSGLPADASVSDIAWSPTGQQLSYAVSAWSPAYSVTTRIVGLDGAVAAELPGLAYASWSSDGGRLAGVRVTSASENALGATTGLGTPVVRDLVSGSETAIGPQNWYWQAPLWSPDGGSLVIRCVSGVSSYVAPDGTTQETRTDCGGDGIRLVSADGSNARVILPTTPEAGPYYGEISWSPAGDTLAVTTYQADAACSGILLVSVETGATRQCIAFPAPFAFGGCGGGGSSDSEWMPDATRLVYHGQFGGGRNGIWIADLATGAETFIPIVPVDSIDISLNGAQLAFGSGGDIWVANTDGTGSAPIADGYTPIWQPL